MAKEDLILLKVGKPMPASEESKKAGKKRTAKKSAAKKASKKTTKKK